MTRERASIFAGDDDALDLSGFAPKSGPEPSEVSAELVRAVAEASRFPSREAKPMRDVRRASIAPAARCSSTPARRRRPSRRSMRSPIGRDGLSARRWSTLWPRCSGSWRGRAHECGHAAHGSRHARRFGASARP